MTIQEICKKCGNQCCKVLHIPNTLEWDQKFIDARGIHQDNNVLIIPHICPQLENNKCTSEELMSLTEQIIKNQNLEFFTYNQIITYCENCKKSWFGILHKCSSCGAISTLTTFDRFAFT